MTAQPQTQPTQPAVLSTNIQAARRGAIVTGVDLGEEVIEAAKGLSTGIDFRVGDAKATRVDENERAS